MAYDEDLAARVRALLGGPDEKRMFGGVAMLLGGHMAVAVRSGGGLMVRVNPADSAAFCTEPGASPTVMRGRPMSGWITVTADACEPDDALSRWVSRGAAFARSLPPKSAR
ncbi:TfoX/Sxy family protein [Catenuloplanes japonicus]|uniref:TfoX/Sxy family protein n=1 Tax=Catenuloplanes japonicus TaxID=33876 RepID=UPI000524C2CB|nr:TfoX/Sxy family protein [Catenuloplanes japonicus]